jgi:predicted phage-related endonuclease
MSHPDRNTYLGAYDIASIVGVNPYCSVEEMTLRKLGVIEAAETNEAMEMGLLFEDAILSRAEKELGKISHRQHFLSHPQYSFLGGTIDGIALANNDIGCPPFLIDAKNLNYFSLKEWEENGIPEVYIVQSNYYSALLYAMGDPIAGAKIAVVFGGQIFRIFDVELDAELGDMLIQKAVEHWQRFIVNKEPINLAQAPIGLLEKYYKKSNGTEIALNDDHVGHALKQYIRLRDEIKERDEALKANKAVIEAAMGESGKGVWTDGNEAISVSWGNTTKKSFDSKLFEKENPELYAKYLKETSYRVLRVTEKNIDKIKKIKGGINNED